MNFLLKNLEHELSDQHLLIGEKLLEAGKVTRLFENETHLWIATVDGFEVEIHISPSRVKGCSCECAVFASSKMCGHLAAGLLKLRRQLSESPARLRQANRSTPQHFQKLTVNAILDSVTQDELAAFVRNFSKTNKAFSLALGAKFAVKVPLADNREKFGQLLDSAIRTYRKANDRISSTGSNHLKKMLEELLGQADDALALEHFADGWAILSAVIGRFSPIVKKCEGDTAALQQLLHSAFLKITQLAKLPIPPDLQAEIWQFCEAEFSRPAYRLNGFSGKLLDTWFTVSLDEEAWQHMLQSIDQELAKAKNLEPGYRSQLLLAKMDLLEKPSLKSAADTFLLECLSDPMKLLQVVEAAEYSGDLRRIKSMVEKGHRLLVSDEVLTARLEATLLNIAQLEGQSDTITEISRLKFLETRDFHYYDQCQIHYKGKWEGFVKKLLADLVRRYDYRQNFPIIATILGREDKLDELLGLLGEQQSLDLLVQFDHFLLKKKPAEVLKLYEQLLKTYLNDHLGLKASKRMRSTLHHLHKQGADGLADQLFASMKVAFPKRRFYLEEIERI